MRLFSRTTLISIFLILRINAIQSQTAQTPFRQVTLDKTEQFTLSSKYVAGENYLIRVGLPVNYDSYDYSFPVLYVLDGDKSFGMTKDIADWLIWFGEIKDIIVVGISYGQGTDAWWEKRERDYTHCQDTNLAKGTAKNTGGAENFLKFVKNELIPVINKKYKALHDSNALMGISYGGMLTSYVLFAQPEMFNGYIIIGPTLIWKNENILKMETEYSGNHKALNKKVYIAYGSLDNKSWVIDPTRELISSIQLHNYEGLKFMPEVLEGETHISSYGTALTHGLKTLFRR
jgi:predicted alpha/beta superfamily hydrolase